MDAASVQIPLVEHSYVPMPQQASVNCCLGSQQSNCNKNSCCSNPQPSQQHPISLFAENELLLDDDCICMRKFVRIINSIYKWSFNLMFYFLLVISVVFVPFIGIFVGFLEFMCQCLRGLTRPVGKLLADALGFSAYHSYHAYHARNHYPQPLFHPVPPFPETQYNKTINC